jgi:hypothetical protein
MSQSGDVNEVADDLEVRLVGGHGSWRAGPASDVVDLTLYFNRQRLEQQ